VSANFDEMKSSTIEGATMREASAQRSGGRVVDRDPLDLQRGHEARERHRQHVSIIASPPFGSGRALRRK
jgi:hypothetical protein